MFDAGTPDGPPLHENESSQPNLGLKGPVCDNIVPSPMTPVLCPGKHLRRAKLVRQREKIPDRDATKQVLSSLSRPVRGGVSMALDCIS